MQNCNLFTAIPSNINLKFKKENWFLRGIVVGLLAEQMDLTASTSNSYNKIQE
jgi:uncharacterized membrane protein